MRSPRRSLARAFGLCASLAALAACGGDNERADEPKAAPQPAGQVLVAPGVAYVPPVTRTALQVPDCKAAPTPATYAPPVVPSEWRRPIDNRPGATVVTSGPILGEVTDQLAAIWIRASRPAPWRIALWTDDESKSRIVDGPALIAEHDFGATLRIGGLQPHTTYRYRVEVGAAGASIWKSEPASFRTMRAAGTPGKVRLIVGGDIERDQNQPIFDQIAALEPDVFLINGDLVYMDEAKKSFSGFASFWENNWNIAQLKRLLTTVPTLMMWDDHEITDDYFVGKGSRYKIARLTYELFAHGHNPLPMRTGKLYYGHQIGDVSMMVLDVRSDRRDPNGPNDIHKTMLGNEQREDLARFLACAPGTFKVLVTGVVLGDLVHGDDSWSMYKDERNEILDFIAAQRVDNLIVVSGDQHWSAIFRYEHEGNRFYELLATPLSKERGRAEKRLFDDVLVRDDDHYAFGVIDFDSTGATPSIALTICAGGEPCKPGQEPPPASPFEVSGASDTVPCTVHITAGDIGPREKP